MNETKMTLSQKENSDRNRHFLVLSTVTMPGMFLYYFFNEITGTDFYLFEIDNLIMLITMVVCILLTAYAIKFNKITPVSHIIVILQTLIIVPEAMCVDGTRQGNAIWALAEVLYIICLIEGKMKYVYLFLEAVMTAIIHLLYYDHELETNPDASSMEFVIGYFVVVVVAAMVYIMVEYEIGLQKKAAATAREQQKQIEELSRARNRFFSSMSHEIRTPINTIIGLNEMILREDISDEVAEDARNIRSASGILLSLINDILDASKIESGKMEIVNAPYDVGKMLSDIVNMIYLRAYEKGLKFTVDVDPTMPTQLFSDEIRIKQILINLLNNAVKYTSEGSVSLSIHARKSSDKKVLVTYSVEDTGMGIRKESIPHLFDAFRREDEKKNRYIEGTGLGLSIVKQLVDLLGGEITVNSVYTKGSTFMVTIEQEIADEKALGHMKSKRGVPGERSSYKRSFEAPQAKVLIVDDNSANLLVTSKLLRETRVQCETVESGAEALKRTLICHYDIILMDHMMPEMDGIECLHAIRSQAGGLCKDTPIVVLTANAGSEDQLLYKKSGFDGYLLKPLDGKLLEDTLCELLPQELLLYQKQEEETRYGSEAILRQMRKKIPLLITTDSVSDLPRELVTKNRIPILPYKIYMGEGIFTDGIEAEGEVIVRYMEDSSIIARSEAPEVEEYEKFFSEQLGNAQHIIHIAMAKNASHGFGNACEAALAFYNVKVVDSGHLSSGMGIMALYAKQLSSEATADPDAIVRALERKKDKIQTSFIVDNTEYLYRSGRLSEKVHRLCHSLLVHPMIVMKDSAMSVGRIFVGSTEKVRRDYVRRVMKHPSQINPSVLFITYAGMRKSEVEAIRDMALEYVPFEKVYFQKASPAISSNCGPGTVGLIFARR